MRSEEAYRIRYKNIFNITQEAYKQEQERIKSLNLKADNLTRYISIYLVMLNAIVLLIFKYAVLNIFIAVMAYVLVFIPSIISLFLATRVQSLSKISRFPDGYLLDERTKDNDDFDNDIDWIILTITEYNKAIKVLECDNDNKAKYIKWAYVMYDLAIVLMTIMSFTILCIQY